MKVVLAVGEVRSREERALKRALAIFKIPGEVKIFPRDPVREIREGWEQIYLSAYQRIAKAHRIWPESVFVSFGHGYVRGRSRNVHRDAHAWHDAHLVVLMRPGYRAPIETQGRTLPLPYWAENGLRKGKTFREILKERNEKPEGDVWKYLTRGLDSYEQQLFQTLRVALLPIVSPEKYEDPTAYIKRG